VTRPETRMGQLIIPPAASPTHPVSSRTRRTLPVCQQALNNARNCHDGGVKTYPLFTMSKTRCWRLRSRPVGEIADKDLELCLEDMPGASASGEMLIKNLFASIDPTHRIWMSDKAQYMPPVALGEVMRAVTVGVVMSSNDPAFAVGQHVVGFGGLAEHYVGVAGQNV
jgi:hypothetical protein